MENKKYLYERGDRHFEYTRRFLILRETKTLYVIESTNGNEIKVPKKSMTIRHGSFSFTHYSTETAELIKEYKYGVLKRTYIKHLDKLKNCGNEEVMNKVLSITIPEPNAQTGT